MKTVDILKKARALLARPCGWTQGEYEDTKLCGGNPVQCFCSIGAIEKFTYSTHAVDAYTKTEEAAAALVEANPGIKRNKSLTSSGQVIEWNDKPRRRPHEVLKAFDRAIAKLEAA